MNDAELRAAAEEVARALGLCVEGYVCPWCGFNPGRATPEKHYEQDTCPHCQFFVEYESRPLDLLTEAGAARLLTLLSEWRIGVNLDYVTNSERKAITLYFGGEPPFATTEGRGDTWPAALVLAARVALRAGWLAEEGSDAE